VTFAVRLTSGQQQGLGELQALASRAAALRIVRTWQESGYLLADISVDCSNLRPAAGGVRMRPRERLTIGVPTEFPFAIPFVRTPHLRWAGTPHVQWGRQPCLYVSPSAEWNPADGMPGYIERLMLWLERAAAGELDAPGEPLHPPVAYPSGEAGLIVVRANASRADGDQPWLGVALLRQPSTGRADLVGWRAIDETWPYTNEQACLAAGLADGMHSMMLAFAVMLPRPLTFEYPTNAAALMVAFGGYGIDAAVTLGMLGVTARINRDLAASAGSADDDEHGRPLYLVVGAPARGVAGAAERITHLAAWQLPPLAERIAHRVPERHSDVPELARIGREVLEMGQDWLASAETSWASVYEARPEVVTPRDAGTPASWLVGKRVLVLGAGALGAPVSEACVRARAARVVVADRGVVHPGILVRQPYEDADIGQAKAAVLAERLRRIWPGAVVEPWYGDVATEMFAEGTAPPDFDLVIDATADRTVRTVIERRRTSQRHAWPELVTLLIGHDACRGIAAISPPGSSGGGLDVLRRLGLAARADVTGDLEDVADDFFPDPPRSDFFQPEPGCSDVTFTGSAADVSGLAGQLLAGVLQALAVGGRGDMAALVVRMPASPKEAAAGAARWLRWPDDVVLQSADGRHEVRLAAVAVAEMRAEARRGARVRGTKVETGGSLLGAFDAAAGVVWVDEATGPPPDSLLSEEHFEHGIEGVEQRIAARIAATARVTAFVGMWHSHPHCVAAPSKTDENGMRELVLPVGTAPPRALLLIVGGPSGRWRSWLATGTATDWYARVVERARGLSHTDPSRTEGRTPEIPVPRLRRRPPAGAPSRRIWRRIFSRIRRRRKDPVS
jgi:integrative and conjugative element protein (TIGR02256 family)